jgi:hypothetical protein
MGVARLLAKGWVAFCLFAGAHALQFALRAGTAPLAATVSVSVCVILFGAMGLLFIGGFGMSSGNFKQPLLAHTSWRDLLPGFDASVFFLFAAVSFAVQVYFIPAIGQGAVGNAVLKALYVVVPGMTALVARLNTCPIIETASNVYSLALASAFAWLLAFIYAASALSRIGLSAGLLRLENTVHPSGFSPTLLAVIYFITAIIGLQLLYVGSLYRLLSCSAFTGVSGAVILGLAPLLLAHVVVAALTTLRASGPAQ